MYYPEDVRRIVEEIREDRTSGSSLLALKSLEAFRKLARTEFTTKQVMELSREVANLRPSMPLIKAFAVKIADKYVSRAGMESVGNRYALLEACREVEEEYGERIRRWLRTASTP